MPFLIDPRLAPVRPDRLERWVDRPVRRTFPRLELALIAAACRLSGSGRRFSPAEGRLLAEIFGESLALDPVRIVETRWLNAPTVLGNCIRIRPGYTFTGPRAAVLVHEAVHLWQFQNFGTGYITDSVVHNLRSLARTGRRALAYMNYQLHANSRFRDFTAEQQATIITDHFELTQYCTHQPNPPAWVVARRADLPIYARLLEDVRGVRPAGAGQ